MEKKFLSFSRMCVAANLVSSYFFISQAEVVNLWFRKKEREKRVLQVWRGN